MDQHQPQGKPNQTTSQTTNSNSIGVTPVESKPKIQFGTIEIAGIIILVLTAIVGFIAQILWQKRQRFIKASAAFRATFNPAIHALETKIFCDREVLREALPSHQEAMFLFREHLKGRNLARFNKDWNEYKEYYDERMEIGLLGFIAVESLDPARIADPTHHAEVEQFRRKEILAHINKLRSYAK